MITLKVLNSIVLLGTSCTFVKAAKMEEKLFDPPPSAVSSRANSRANRTKHCQMAPQQGCPLTLCSFHLKTHFIIESSADKRVSNFSPTEPTATKTSEPEASDVCQTTHPTENANCALPKSDSDTFLTTPDEEDDEKIINSDTGLDGEELKPRTPKKDLLEIDRFTICGNRID